MKVNRQIICSFISVALLVTVTGVSRAEDSNMSFVGHIGGGISDVAVSGNYAYVGEGQDFVVLDITDAANPKGVGKISMPGLVTDIDISGNYAYITRGINTIYGVNGLTVVDISNPLAIKTVGSYQYSRDYVSSVTISGDYAYLTCLTGLEILDISNPSTPVFVGKYYDQYGVTDVAVSGNYAYVAKTYGLGIVDITDPTSPKGVGSYNPSNKYVYDVAVSGNYAYAAVSEIGLVILNITNSSSPTLAGSYAGRAYDIALADNYAYVADTSNGLLILDLTNSSSPTLVGNYAGGAYDIALADNYAYAVTDSGLSIIDITNKSSPMLSGTYDTINDVRNVFVKDNFAYIPDAKKGITIIDITDPSSPKLAGRYPIGSPISSLVVSGNYAYLVCENSSLAIVDISNPSSPKFVSSCYTGFSFGGSVVLAGNYAYVAYSMGLAIVDISNPLSPRLAGSYHDARYPASGIAIAGNYAYIASRDSGFIVIDIANPTLPKLVCSYNPGISYSNDIAVAGNYAYIASNNGLWVVNITNSSSPVFEGKLGVSAQGIHLSGKYAYVSGLFNGLYVADITNVSSPTIVAHYGTAGVTYNSCIKGDYVYVADERNGLVILKTDFSEQSPDPVIPVAKFTSNITEGYAPLSVQFTDLSENATNWEWQFGDDFIVLGQKNVTHVYDYPGLYNVTLMVSNPAGRNTTTKTDYINVTVDENEVLKSKLVEKVNKQIALMASTDPMKYYDTKEASKYMNTIGILKKQEYDAYINNIGLYRGLQSQMLQNALVQAKKGDEAKVNRDLNLANQWGQNALISFQNANGLYISTLNNGIFVAKEIQTVSLIAFKIVGTASGLPPGALEALDYVVLVYDDVAIEGKTWDQTNWDIVKEVALTSIINTETSLPGMDGNTIQEYLSSPELWRGKTGKEIYLTLCNALKSDEAATIVYSALQKEFPGITQEVATQIWDGITYQIDKGTNSNYGYQMASIKSPGELRVYDSGGNVTGLVNGETVQDIPNSVYDAENKSVIILESDDIYSYEVVGIGTGEYGLELLSVKGTEYNLVSLRNTVIPNEVHQYTVDWNSVAIEKAVNLNIDSNGDGTFEQKVKMQLPTASFTNMRLTNQQISFDGSSSKGNIVSYKWDFGDGTSGSGKMIDHTYSAEGDYAVTLTVENDNAGIDSKEKNIRIDFTSPITTANLSGALGDKWYTSEVQVNLTATDGMKGTGINKTEYSFDNSNWSIYSTPFNISNKGVTTLYYHSIDNAGNIEITKSETIQIGEEKAPITIEAGSNQTEKEGTNLTFKGNFTTSGSHTYSYHWDFGDGSVEDGSLTISHTYADDGTYTVNLTVTDEEGDFGNDILLVTVNNAIPVVNAGSDLEVTAGNPISFTGTFSDSGWLDTHTAEWNFGEGTIEAGSVSEENEYPDSTGAISGNFSYFNAGNYTVVLNVSDDDGGFGQDQAIVTVRPIAATVNLDPDTLNLGSGGNWVTAYIELPQGYSASNIDVSSVLLNGFVPAVSDSKYGFVTDENEYLTDLDKDGISERLFKFNRGEVEGILKSGDQVTVTFTGKVEYNNGISSGMASFEGSDLIKVVEKGSKKDKTK